MAQWIKDTALSLWWLRSLLRPIQSLPLKLGYVTGIAKKKKKEKKINCKIDTSIASEHF